MRDNNIFNKLIYSVMNDSMLDMNYACLLGVYSLYTRDKPIVLGSSTRCCVEASKVMSVIQGVEFAPK